MASVPNPEKPGAWSGGQEYGMAAEAPQAAAGGGPTGAQRPIWWYVPRATGKREGPVPLDALKQRLAAGGLSSEDLVWREGMAEWVPARTVPELTAPRPGPSMGQGPPPFPSAPSAPVKPVAAGPSAAEILQQAQNLFATAAFYRLVGLACAGLCAVWLLVAFIVWAAWGNPWARGWFTEALLFALVFIVSHGIAAILERLDRAGSRDKP